MKNILITGANGLIGNELIRELKDSYTVYAVSRTNPNIDSENVIFIRQDLTSPWNIGVLPKKIDAIYHLAQSENFRDFPEKSNDIFHVNTTSTLNLLEYARKAGCKKFIYASSGGVYGTNDKSFAEDTPIINHGKLGFYLSTKLCSELLVENYAAAFDVIITRFFFVYGKRQDKTMLIPRLVLNVRNNNPITLQGKEGIKINPIHVSDAARALFKILQTEGSQKFNIGGNEILSLKQIGETIGEQLNKEPVFLYDNNVANHLIGDIRKMKDLLASPQQGIKMGIEELINN